MSRPPPQRVGLSAKSSHLSHGRQADAYRAFLRVSINALDDDEYLMFVLPQSFLSARAAERLRHELASSMSIEVIAT